MVVAAVVTGAGQGIGRALALSLARAGHPVGLQARSEVDLLETARAIEGVGGRSVVVPGDVTEAESAERLCARAEAELGAPIGIAVANAGQAISAPLLKTSEADLRALLDVNLVSVFHLLQAAARRMLASKTRGRIVVMASTAAVAGMRYTSAYAASKHGVLGLVKSAALELAPHGITVNALCPGWVDTPMFDRTADNIAKKSGGTPAEAKDKIRSWIPIGDVLQPDEVAAMFAYVVSPAASKLTGQALVLDGGETL